jgi:glutamyl-tRNA synthetase
VSTRVRFAPSPTGSLHLGNALTAVANRRFADDHEGAFLLRIDDTDPGRTVPGGEGAILEDLRWLGLDWDEGPIYQTLRYAEYEAATEQLLARGEAYPCVCTRKDVAGAASAPHGPSGDKVPVYPGTCRGKFASVQAAFDKVGKIPAVRFKVPQGTVEFIDHVQGHVSFDVARRIGDFVIAKSEGTASYQLAVVVDDAAMGVTDVIPAYYHLPLVVGTDGRRLAKRHGDTRLAAYRAANVAPARMLALMARWLGVGGAGDSILLDELLQRFDLAKLPEGQIVFTEEDDAFLRAGTSMISPKSRSDSLSPEVSTERDGEATIPPA